MLLEFLQRQFQEQMGPPLVQLDYFDWTVSIHQDERLGLLWVRDLVLNGDGRRSRFISRAQDEPTTPYSFVRLGGRSRGNWRSVGGKLFARATRAEGYCDSGLPVNILVEEDLFCAIMPRYQPVVLRFWKDDGSVQEYRVSEDIEQPIIIRKPWWSRLTNWITTTTSRQIVKGSNFTMVTYSDKRKSIFTRGSKNRLGRGK